jgi:integrase
MKAQQGYLTRSSGKWLGHYSLWQKNSITGERKRQQKAFVLGFCSEMTKTQARIALRSRIETELALAAPGTEKSELKQSPSPTLAWFIENRWTPLREGTWRGNTPVANRYFFSHIIKRFGSEPLDRIDAVTLQVWLNALAKTYSGSVVRHVRLYLKSFFVEAVEQDYIRKSPARHLRLPVVKSPAKPVLSQDEIKRLLDVAHGKYRLLLRVELATALRPSELFALRWKSFDPQKNLLRITESVYRRKIRPFTKTTDSESDSRLLRVYLPFVLVEELKNWRNGEPDHAFIFSNHNGNPMERDNCHHRVFKTLAKNAGIPKLNFQILRRTVATHLQWLGSPHDIAGVMRHTKPNTAAEHYIQVVDESVRQAAERLASVLL